LQERERGRLGLGKRLERGGRGGGENGGRLGGEPGLCDSETWRDRQRAQEREREKGERESAGASDLVCIHMLKPLLINRVLPQYQHNGTDVWSKAILTPVSVCVSFRVRASK
jgi:hypothetical protein